MIRKIMRWVKRLQNSKTQLTEKYIINERYIEHSEVVQFIKERKQYCSSYGINIFVGTGDFSEGEYGEVLLMKNGKIIDRAKLLKGHNDLIFWSFL